MAGPRSKLPLKIIVEKHPDGYVAYPLGLRGVVVGEDDTIEGIEARLDKPDEYSEIADFEDFAAEIVRFLQRN